MPVPITAVAAGLRLEATFESTLFAGNLTRLRFFDIAREEQLAAGGASPDAQRLGAVKLDLGLALVDLAELNTFIGHALRQHAGHVSGPRS